MSALAISGCPPQTDFSFVQTLILFRHFFQPRTAFPIPLFLSPHERFFLDSGIHTVIVRCITDIARVLATQKQHRSTHTTPRVQLSLEICVALSSARGCLRQRCWFVAPNLAFEYDDVIGNVHIEAVLDVLQSAFTKRAPPGAGVWLHLSSRTPANQTRSGQQQRRTRFNPFLRGGGARTRTSTVRQSKTSRWRHCHQARRCHQRSRRWRHCHQKQWYLTDQNQSRRRPPPLRLYTGDSCCMHLYPSHT